MYTILKLGLPHPTEGEDEARGLAFDFLADPPQPTGDAPRVMTGHDNGLITIALAEADDAERERRRTAMGEPYRTLLGHLRHEVGHYYWDRLVADRGAFDEFRAMFGDERAGLWRGAQGPLCAQPRRPLGRCLCQLLRPGPPVGGLRRDLGPLPAHHRHAGDRQRRSGSGWIRRRRRWTTSRPRSTSTSIRVQGIEPIVEAWLPLSFAVNSLNRSMGLPDLYPFVLSPPVIEKLGYIHRLVRRRD